MYVGTFTNKEQVLFGRDDQQIINAIIQTAQIKELHFFFYLGFLEAIKNPSSATSCLLPILF